MGLVRAIRTTVSSPCPIGSFFVRLAPRVLIRIRKLVLYLLLALMPLQSVASAAQALFCDSDIEHSAVSASHHHDDGSHDAMEGESRAAAHDGCHHNVTNGVVAALRCAAEPVPSVYEIDRPEYFLSHFPEQLKRPPLALAD